MKLSIQVGLAAILGIAVVVLAVMYFSKKKTVYLVWQNLRAGAKSNGFGDKIRAAIATYQYCRGRNIRLVIDGTEDICGKFLNNVKSSEYDTIRHEPITNIDCPNSSEYCGFDEKLDAMLAHKDAIFIYTNKCPKGDDCVSYKPNVLSKQEKEFAKFLCEPQDFLRDEIDRTIQTLPENYGIQHFRFSDKVFDKDIDEHDPMFIQFFNTLKNTYKRTDVLLSNSTNFKRYAKQMLNIKTIDCDGDECTVGHIGNSQDMESVKMSFIEFYVITKAKYVKTVSKYDWVSNFIKWPCVIYDIPLTENK